MAVFTFKCVKKTEKRGGSKFQLPLWEGGAKGGEIETLKNVGGSIVQGQVFLKDRVCWHFSYLIFSRSIVFTFRNYITLHCRIVLSI